jgi:glycine/D-amino acid oxidase-like deaminating enzyme
MSQFSNPKEENYWMVPPPTTKDYTNKELPPKTDVLVIGSGYTGVVAALQLKKAGVNVTLIDKTKIGSQASAKNGGMALNGLSVSLNKVRKNFGQHQMVLFFQEFIESINSVERLVKEGQIDCFFKRSGYISAAYKPAHFETLKKNQEFLAKHLNYTTSMIPPEKMRDEIESDFYHGGLFDPTSAGVQPAKYIAGLIRMADETGVDLHEGVEALEIKSSAGKSVVQTNRGDVEAEQVIVATNGYTSKNTPWLMKRIVPVESFMIATEQLPLDVAKKLIPNNRMISDTKRFLFYFRLSPDGRRVMFGARPKQFWKSALEKARMMRQDMLRVFPQLDKYGIEYTWSGKVGFTANKLPIIGEQNGVFYGMGYSGRGVGLATYFGCKLAELILKKGGDTIYSQNKPIKIPLYSGKPWFLPIAHTIYRIQDKFS